MIFSVIDQYNSFVENNFIKTSEAQLEVLRKLNLVWNKNKKKGLFINSKKKKMAFTYMEQLEREKLFY